MGRWLADHWIPIAIAAAMFCAMAAGAGEVLLSAQHNGHWRLHLFLVWGAGSLVAWPVFMRQMLLSHAPDSPQAAPLMRRACLKAALYGLLGAACLLLVSFIIIALIAPIPVLYACGLVHLYGSARKGMFEIGQSESDRQSGGGGFERLASEGDKAGVRSVVFFHTAVCNLIGSLIAAFPIAMMFMAAWSSYSGDAAHITCDASAAIAAIVIFGCQCYGFKKVDEVFAPGRYGNPNSKVIKLLQACDDLPSDEGTPPLTELRASWMCPRCGEERNSEICPVCGTPCLERFAPASFPTDSIRGTGQPLSR